MKSRGQECALYAFDFEGSLTSNDEEFTLSHTAVEYLKELLKNDNNKVCIFAETVDSQFVREFLKLYDLTDAEIDKIVISDSSQHLGNKGYALAEIIQADTRDFTKANIFANSDDSLEKMKEVVVAALFIDPKKINANDMSERSHLSFAADLAQDHLSISAPTSKQSGSSKTGLFSRISSMAPGRAKTIKAEPQITDEARQLKEDKLAFNAAKKTLMENLSSFIKTHKKDPNQNALQVFRSTLDELVKAETGGKEWALKFVRDMQERLEGVICIHPGAEPRMKLQEMKYEFSYITQPFLDYKNSAKPERFVEVRDQLFQDITKKVNAVKAGAMQKILFSPNIKSDADFDKTLTNILNLVRSTKDEKDKRLIPILENAQEQLHQTARVSRGGPR